MHSISEVKISPLKEIDNPCTREIEGSVVLNYLQGLPTLIAANPFGVCRRQTPKGFAATMSFKLIGLAVHPAQNPVTP
jgi:hypothetical protein